MTEPNSIMNIGDLAKPVTTLIERISDATGAVFTPWQMKRIAKAEVETNKIKAHGDADIADIHHRAEQRRLAEEAKRQENIENITAKALPEVKSEAKPEQIENDWLTDFFDKCRLVSDEEMQTIWANLLAGEANQPGTFSKRTINLVSTLDKYDAELFTLLCSFGWKIAGKLTLLVYYYRFSEVDFRFDPSIYIDFGLTLDVINHLESIGLIRFQIDPTFFVSGLAKKEIFQYHEKFVDLEFIGEEGNHLKVGNILLTKTGQELALLCKPNKVDGLYDFIKKRMSFLGEVAAFDGVVRPWTV